MHNNKDALFFCRICGFRQLDPPWGEDNKNPNFAICDCCGVEFGYEDCDLNTIRKYRLKWQESGAEWFEPKEKPIDWSLEEQMKNIPQCYL